METLVVLGILLILQIHFIVGENDEKEKRLLLNDPDVVGQISRMQSNIDILKQLVSSMQTNIHSMTSKHNTVESELAAQELKNTGTKMEIDNLDRIKLSTMLKHVKTSSHQECFSYILTTHISNCVLIVAVKSQTT